ncbi:unnamed protein product [Medioppia subpectinata]|uniref:BAG domain-containing protein n=1 Tax=Medioppia subpectinata TaxID=1979941 RepID=A0A7R9Q3U5_9ACAR|nr:unnamed protein product [Medioppia subpectinata]CAG2111688.1 unnamed protein product [Medioppia subpectinata]
MSFKNNRFDRFSPLDPESRLQDFRKRFDQLSQNPNQMFRDSSLGNRWSDRLNDHPIYKNFNNNSKRSETEEEEGVPIQVVHEKSDDMSNPEANERKSESMSSSQSHKSSDTSHSSGSARSAGSVFHSSPMDSSSGQASGVQPRVHHIPISVEPRNGSTSSGYTSESNGPNPQSLSRSSSHSSSHSSANSASTGHTKADNRSPSPAKSVSSEHSNASTDSKPRVHQIGVTIETNAKPNGNGLSQTTDSSKKQKSGPFVTRIPVTQPTETLSDSQSTDKCDQKVVVKVNPLESIHNTLSDLKKYESEVNGFNGTANDKKYKYLDEMLTRCMIKLDTIETDGNEEVRKARKGAVIAVNKCITLLESKVFDNNNKSENSGPINGNESTVEPMEVSSTPEPTSGETNQSSHLKSEATEAPVIVNDGKIQVKLYRLRVYKRLIQSKPLKGKVVVITGASSGLGTALAQVLYRSGARLILSSRRVDQLNEVKERLISSNQLSDDLFEPKVLALDLSKLEDMESYAEEALSFYGSVDVIINNGGISYRGSVIDTTVDVDRQVMLVNYFGQLALIKAFLPSMIARNMGQIVVISSIQGQLALPYRSAYTASKHALQAFCDSLRAELFATDVSVLVISPGYIKTNLSMNAITGSGDTYGQMDKTTASGDEPEDVAKRILMAIIRKDKQLLVSPLLPKIAILLRFIFPNIYFYLMKKRAKKETKN